MKKIFVIFAHPKKNSFCSAIKDEFIKNAEKAGNKIDLCNLYEIDFDPVFDGSTTILPEIKSFQDRIDYADVIAFIYPIWWFRAPAILEGFIDRVFIPPWAFEYKSIIGFYGYPIGKLSGKKAIILNTYGSPRLVTRFFFLNLPIRRKKRGFLNVCGIRNIIYKGFFSVPFISESERQIILQKVSKIAKNV